MAAGVNQRKSEAPISQENLDELFGKNAEKNQKSIVIQAVSSGFAGGKSVKITLNGSPLVIQKNESNHHRGLNIAIINPYGTVEVAKAFDTYKSSKEFDGFILTQDIHRGSVVIAASCDDCVSSLSQNGKEWLSNMGSKEIWNL